MEASSRLDFRRQESNWRSSFLSQAKQRHRWDRQLAVSAASNDFGASEGGSRAESRDDSHRDNGSRRSERAWTGPLLQACEGQLPPNELADGSHFSSFGGDAGERRPFVPQPDSSSPLPRTLKKRPHDPVVPGSETSACFNSSEFIDKSSSMSRCRQKIVSWCGLVRFVLFWAPEPCGGEC